ncbi:MAG: SCO family protein [Congregibacter sp.]|nr:SCO family protein [Congregibacter sp.]
MSNITREKLMAAVLIAAAVVGVALAGSGYWALWQSRNPAADQLMPASLITFPERKPLAEFILVDDEKGVFDLKSLESRWSFIFFGFMYCPDICPTTLYDLSLVKRDIVAQGISESDIQFVFISVDPARDKAAQIQRYVQYFDPAFLGATGSMGQLTNLTRQLGAPFRAEPETAENVYEVTHSSAVYLVDPLGQYTGIISPPFVASEVAVQFSELYRTNETPKLARRR